MALKYMALNEGFDLVNHEVHGWDNGRVHIVDARAKIAAVVVVGKRMDHLISTAGVLDGENISCTQLHRIVTTLSGALGGIELN